jgi:hypothetical protein
MGVVFLPLFKPTGGIGDEVKKRFKNKNTICRCAIKQNKKTALINDQRAILV